MWLFGEIPREASWGIVWGWTRWMSRKIEIRDERRRGEGCMVERNGR